MVVIIGKNAASKEIDEALKKLQESKKRKNLISFYGKLKGAFGDAMEYQKKVR